MNKIYIPIFNSKLMFKQKKLKIEYCVAKTMEYIE